MGRSIQFWLVDGSAMSANEVCDAALEYGYAGSDASEAAKHLTAWGYDVQPPGECQRCIECLDASHHWLEDPQEDPEAPEYGCKHCPQRGRECEQCEGEGCVSCLGEGVIPADQAIKSRQ